MREFLKIIQRACELIEAAEQLDHSPAEKRVEVISGIKELAEQLPSLAAAYKTTEFIGMIVDLMVAISNIQKKPSEAIGKIVTVGVAMLTVTLKKKDE